jgi:cytochrome c peroxidase
MKPPWAARQLLKRLVALAAKRAGATRALAFVFLLASLAFPVVASSQVQTYTCAKPGFGPVAVVRIPPTVLMQSLKTVPNPVIPHGLAGEVRGDLADFIANPLAAVQLGKALFWEMQAGSDNKTACASCHFHAGADGRTRNQMNPGANGFWDGDAPNSTLVSTAFPFTTRGHDRDNVTGSQGVRKSSYFGLGKGSRELIESTADAVFADGGHNARQVTGKNTPSTVNAIFNHRNFWNGRAQPEFNGVNPWGTRDTAAHVWTLVNGRPAQISIAIKNASAASQAVGPALNSTEMSAEGRTFADLGQRLLRAKPLAEQKVDSTDSVLGPLADGATGKGLTVSYASMIQAAFQPQWWNYSNRVPNSPYTMMEANFSLYWGIAIMMYEATLVADSSPMDEYLLTRIFSATEFDPVTGMPLLISHDPTLLDPVVNRLAAEGISLTRDHILTGLALFERPVAPPPSFPPPAGFGVGCIFCHVGAETTSASVRNLTGDGVEVGDVALKNAGFDMRMERMFMNLSWPNGGQLTPAPLGSDAITFDPATYQVNVVDQIIPFPFGFSTQLSPAIPLPAATYDTGWYNVGVRPTADDLGLGAVDAFNQPLSWTRLFQSTTPDLVQVPGTALGCPGAGNATFPDQTLNPLGFPLLSGPLRAQEATDVDGSFKVPSLRDVELSGPYFHNGGRATLKQVVEFYDEGGNFESRSKAPAVVPLQLSEEQMHGLVAFLVSLTDDRVRLQQAPFDHPELLIAAGQDDGGADITTILPAVGADGAATSLPRFLGLSPFTD